MIPQIVAVVLDKRPKGAKPYKFPDKCPVCGSHAVARGRRGGAALHRRADLPGAGGGAAEAFRVAQRLRHRRARRKAGPGILRCGLDHVGRPTSSRSRSATRAREKLDGARRLRRSLGAQPVQRDRRAARDRAASADLRARHSPCRRGQCQTAGAALRHDRGVSRGDAGRGRPGRATRATRRKHTPI